jgi:hypothetical protein
MLNLVPGPDPRRSRAVLAAVALAIAVAPGAAFAQSAAVLVASHDNGGLVSPLNVAAPAGDGRLFIVERAGTIKVLQNGAVLGTNFLDITDRVIVPPTSEAGLLSLVFDPDYATNGRFYVYYVGDADGGPGETPEIRIARFVAADPASSATVDNSTESILFRLVHPNSNHFGGTVAIRGGFLYAGIGDGGGGGDPDDHSQDDASYFGKMLRFDLAQPGEPPWTPEIWAKGFRNPYRFSFDSLTGDLYVGDVGQETIEEVDVEPAASPGGLNYGWDVMEGTTCYTDPDGFDPGEPPCNDPSLTLPAYEYPHDGTCLVTGGTVYRGRASRSLRGLYFFTDGCAARITTFRWNPSTGLAEDVTDRHDEFLPDVGGSLQQLVAIAPDGFGELYAVSLNNQAVYKLVPEPAASLLGAAALSTLLCVARRRRVA